MHNQISAKDPFFLVYDSRSGSTFIANLIMRHLGVVVPPEARFVVPVLREYASQEISNGSIDCVLNAMYRDPKFQDWGLDQSTLADRLHSVSPMTVARVVVEACAMYRDINYPERRVLGLKKGAYVFRRDLIKANFPDAKFVAIVRDGRAIFNSKKSSLYSATGKPFETSPSRAAEEWVKFCSELEAARAEYPGDVMMIKYEDLIEDHMSQLENISKLLNVEFQVEGQGNYQVAERYEGLHDNALKQPMVERVSAWRTQLAYDEIEEFESVAFEVLVGYGYEPVSAIRQTKTVINKSRTTERLRRRIADLFSRRR